MKKAIICALVLCSIAFGGCQSASVSSPETPDSNESASINDADNVHDSYNGDGDATFVWSEEVSDEQPAFESYALKVQRNALSVYDKPGYNSGNLLYDITDRRTIIIVAETVVRENGNIRKWGQLQSGGWVSLTAADVVDDEEAAGANGPGVDHNAEIPQDPAASSPEHTTESTPKAPPSLDGTLVDDAANVYGCGREHTAEVNGIRFHWYDRYEHRSKDNTTVFSSIDILSFTMRYSKQETSVHQNDLWYIDYEIDVSGGSSAKLRWFAYDENQYRKDDVPVLNGELKGKCAGTAYFAEVQMSPSIVTFAELAPSMSGRS